MKIQIAKTDIEIFACYPILHELRPQLEEATFIQKIRELEQSGYLLAYLLVAGAPVAVAGFHQGESLAWGRYLYVDDLVTFASHRSRGYGAALLTWLTEHARQQGCDQLHLDSGVQRKDAHRFYEREGLQLASYHYAKIVSP